MVKWYLFLCISLFSCGATALEVRVFDDEKRIYLVLLNDSSNLIEVAEALVIGDCRSLANVCFSVISGEGEKQHFLSSPMNFDTEFKKRKRLWPGQLVGKWIEKQEIINYFNLAAGEYKLTIHYRNYSLRNSHASNVLLFKVKEK